MARNDESFEYTKIRERIPASHECSTGFLRAKAPEVFAIFDEDYRNAVVLTQRTRPVAVLISVRAYVELISE